MKVFVARRPRPAPDRIRRSSNIRIENVSIIDAPWMDDPSARVGRRRDPWRHHHQRRPRAQHRRINIDSCVTRHLGHTIEVGRRLHRAQDRMAPRSAGGVVPADGERDRQQRRCAHPTIRRFKIGTESRGDFRNITITNCAILQSPRLYRAPTAGSRCRWSTARSSRT